MKTLHFSKKIYIVAYFDNNYIVHYSSKISKCRHAFSATKNGVLQDTNR